MAIIGFDLAYRANQAGFGTASDGQVWAPAQNNGTLAVSNNELTVTGSVANSSQWLGSNKSTNFDLRVFCTRTGTANAGCATGALGRATNTGTYYGARLHAGALEIIKSISGAITILASVAYSITGGAVDGLHFQINGTTLSANAWPDDGTRSLDNEPNGWMLSLTDSSIGGAGNFGLATTLSNGADIASYDNFSCDDLTLPAPNWLPKNPYGLTLGLTNKNPPTANYAYWSYLFGDMKNIGLTRVRFQISFNLIWITLQNPSNPLLDDPSLWSWGPLDDAVAKANQEGVYISFPIRQTPTWCHTTPSQQTTTLPQFATDPTITAFIASVVVTRYNGLSGHGTLNAIELGNEDFNIIHTTAPSIGIYNSPYVEYNGLAGVHFGIEPARDPHFFSPVLAACVPAIRAASSTIEIIACAVWWLDNRNVFDFIDVVFQEAPTAAAQVTAWNLHYYSNTRDPNTQGSGTTIYAPSLLQTLTSMHGALVKHGAGSTLIDITEIGWGTNTNGGSSIDCDTITQMQRYQVCYDVMRTFGYVRAVYLFTLNYKTQNRQSPPAPTTLTSSLVQWNIPSQSYLQLPAYGMLKQYIASYPQWPGTTAFMTINAPGPDGNVVARGLDGMVIAGGPG